MSKCRYCGKVMPYADGIMDQHEDVCAMRPKKVFEIECRTDRRHDAILETEKLTAEELAKYVPKTVFEIDECVAPKKCNCSSCSELAAEMAAERRYIALENEREWKEQEWEKMGRRRE